LIVAKMKRLRLEIWRLLWRPLGESEQMSSELLKIRPFSQIFCFGVLTGTPKIVFKRTIEDSEGNGRD